MKATGIVRKIDKLGRIVLPIELRTTMKISSGDSIEIFVEEDSVILKKYENTCIFCGKKENVENYHDKNICKKCIKELAKKAD